MGNDCRVIAHRFLQVPSKTATGHKKGAGVKHLRGDIKGEAAKRRQGKRHQEGIMEEVSLRRHRGAGISEEASRRRRF